MRVVDERPPVYLAHTMVMVGGSPDPLGLDPGVGGYACEIDCADVLSRETVLVFGDGRTPQEIAQTIVHEVGHSWGLDHVEDLDLIMNGTTSGADRSFSEGCTALEDPSSSECAQWHAEFCDEPGTQDTVAEVMAVRGPAFVDLQPPRIEIRAPQDGAEIWPGEHVRIEVDVEDDHPGVGWQLVVPELEWSERSDHGIFDLQFPEGRYTLRVEAMDQAGNEAVEEITLRVGEPTAEDPGEDEPVEGEDEPAASPDDTSDEASGCRIGAGSPAPTWMLLLMLPLWRRPRR